MDTRISTLYDADYTTGRLDHNVQLPEVSTLVKNEREKPVHLPLDIIMKLVLGPDMEMKSKLEKLVSDVQEEEQYRIAMQAFLEACANGPSQSHDERFVKLVNVITGIVYHFDSDWGYKTLSPSHQSLADWQTITGPGRDASALFCWNLKGKANGPSRVQNHPTRNDQEPPSINQHASLKRSIDAISDRDMAAEPDAKRARISESSDIVPPTIPHVGNVGLETTESCPTTAYKIATCANRVCFCLQLDSLQLIYYGGSGTMASGLLSIREDPAAFIVMVVSLLRLAPEERSMPPFVGDINNPTEGSPGNTSKAQTILCGRATCILEASYMDMGDIELLSFPQMGHQSEVDVLDNVIGTSPQRSKRIHIHLRTKFSSLDDHSAVNDGPDGRLWKCFEENNKFSHKKHVMRLILLEELTPIDELRQVRDYAQAFFDTLQVHRLALDVLEILHRDLSQSNIMVRRDSQGHFRGVISDWDLSSHSKSITRSQLRAGTLPFIAHDLHHTEFEIPPTHRYRHDLESLFFVMVLLFCRNRFNTDASTISRPLEYCNVKTFKHWSSLDETKLGATKHSFLARVHGPCPLAGFETFSHWMKALRIMFYAGISCSMLRGGGDEELYLEGVTYEAFFAIMATFKDTPTSSPLVEFYPPSD